jgi:hypothetical protein
VKAAEPKPKAKLICTVERVTRTRFTKRVHQTEERLWR